MFAPSWGVLPLFTVGMSSVSGNVEHHKYCIIGAGPAGVQLGHFLHAANRDYVILERAAQAASFFSKFPIHRTLNSINRRHTRSGSLEFNLRHDWNSLLGQHETIPLFRNWSREYWPPADTLVDYINAFAAAQLSAGHVRFGHTVTNIATAAAFTNDTLSRDDKSRYLLTVDAKPASSCHEDAKSAAGQCQAQIGSTLPLVTQHFSCSVLVMANGMWQPRRVQDWIDGLVDVAVPYSELDGIPIDDFENRSVLILGYGNAATETADAVRNVAREIQIIHRSDEDKEMRNTKYVGHVRARRTTIQDAFELKSYEAILSIEKNNLIVMVPCGPNLDNLGFRGKPPICAFHVLPTDPDVVVLAPVEKAFADLINETKQLFGNSVFIREAPSNQRSFAEQVKKLKLTMPFFVVPVLCMRKSTLKGTMTLQQRQLLIRLRDSSAEITWQGIAFQKPFDVVVSSLGWVYDQSLFDKSVTVKMMGPPKMKFRSTDEKTYPDLNSEFESVSAKHLFVAGSASHGRDRYRYMASGGFIHGFRFNCRTLWRILEDRYEVGLSGAQAIFSLHGSTSFPWHFVELPTMNDLLPLAGLVSELQPSWAKLRDRINDAAGPFEMVGGSLSDAIVYDCKNWTSWYLEDLPEDLIHERYLGMPRVTWSYYYGVSSEQEPGLLTYSSGVMSRYIHPVLQYFPAGIQPGPMTAKKTRLMRYKHPSRIWDKITGVSRLHIKESYAFLDWSDPGVVKQLQFFMSHVEQAAGKFCLGKGNGRIKQNFDEAIDTDLSQKKEE
eukprot:gnl/MRDRNA2_/MRDRNA2_69305_c0_seq2.p1 gnl/MRDRNA2_/MRDRNA2_69305_c0~~gnl/MRDRNA2_/MRDRNA2_69305_c0_seq2.p1  ORF type:complete len:779 (-),score=109.38 gnl/MRDRNA2_/MRDRNA2_69305_c0_seq2:205-2541(-)